jgi:hypothetical protein
MTQFLIGLQTGCQAFDHYFIAAFVAGLLVAGIGIGVAWILIRGKP